MMLSKPSDLQALLLHSPSASRYFYALPSYLQELVRRSQKNICTESELHQYADQLLRSLHS